jgi:hypothetical protein
LVVLALGEAELGNEGIAVPVLGARGYQLRLRS